MSVPPDRTPTKRRDAPPLAPRPRYVPAVGPRLRKLLYGVLALFTLLTVNSLYLAAVTIMEWLRGETIQNLLYQYMFLAHLALGLLAVLPILVYGAIHFHNAWPRPNRRAVKAGIALFSVSVALLISGLLLTRGLPLVEIRHPQTREVVYWIHVVAPLLVVWLFILHRLAGKRINWKFGGGVLAVGLGLAGVAMAVMVQDPRRWGEVGPAGGERYFFPSLARTASGNFIPAEALMNDEYCRGCHADIHAQWSSSAHRFASFNNPAYLFSVRNTRAKMLARDDTVQGARFCAGCHDLVPFFSGAFDDPDFDDVADPTAAAGITCTGCHAITHINSPRGNADYTIEEPLHYPFAFSDNRFLRYVNETLIKAKPAFHKRTFLKPLHRSAEFCGACHKVHLPEELNGYRWLRGQNHYDSFLLSGVSGHGLESFYYPDQAEPNCNGCHMTLLPSDDFGARPDDQGRLTVHDHLFPSANTAIAVLMDQPPEIVERHREFLAGSVSLDLFGLRGQGRIDGPLNAPLGADGVTLEPGETYLLEIVIRTRRLGHLFTEGTADSNQVWLEVTASAGGRIFAASGFMNPDSGEVDPYAHYVNAYVLDREGRRIDRRNAEDIFTALYNHQIPPGAADVVFYRLELPPDLDGPVTLRAALNYRKFDTRYLRLFSGDPSAINELPVSRVAAAEMVIGQGAPANAPSPYPLWQRWNDYGIGLLRKPGLGALRQAEQAFSEVAAQGRSEGLLNLARTYLREGRLADAEAVLARAADHPELNHPWTHAWLTAELNLENGFLDEAIAGFRALTETPYVDAQARGFDFSRDYRLLERLALTLYERSRAERRDEDKRAALLREAVDWFERALELEPERAASHYGLSRAFDSLGETERAARHRELHERYKVDDNARDRAVAAARRADPAADRAADAVVIYELEPIR